MNYAIINLVLLRNIDLVFS